MWRHNIYGWFKVNVYCEQRAQREHWITKSQNFRLESPFHNTGAAVNTRITSRGYENSIKQNSRKAKNSSNQPLTTSPSTGSNKQLPTLECWSWKSPKPSEPFFYNNMFWRSISVTNAISQKLACIKWFICDLAVPHLVFLFHSLEPFMDSSGWRSGRKGFRHVFLYKMARKVIRVGKNSYALHP